MRIIGFNFTKISCERKKDIKGKLEIKSNLQIEDIKQEKIDIAGEILKFHYSYSVTYEPGFAEIQFKGSVLVVPDKPEEIKQILKEWKKKKLEDNIRLFVFNFIISKCNLKALQLEEEFSLPLHIPLPRLTKQAQQQGKANYTG